MIIKTFPLGPIATNALLIACPETKQAAVIDAPVGSYETLSHAAQKLGLTLVLHLFTHSHWDHIAEAALWKKNLHLPIYIHPLDAPNLINPGADGLPLYFPIEGVQPDHLLSDGEHFKLGSLDIEVIHTPGHARGSVCFYIASEKVLISGDTLFRGTIGTLNLPTSQPDLMWPSLKRLSQLPPDTRVFPGHGEPTTIGDESWIARARPRTT